MADAPLSRPSDSDLHGSHPQTRRGSCAALCTDSLGPSAIRPPRWRQAVIHAIRPWASASRASDPADKGIEPARARRFLGVHAEAVATLLIEVELAGSGRTPAVNQSETAIREERIVGSKRDEQWRSVGRDGHRGERTVDDADERRLGVLPGELVTRVSMAPAEKPTMPMRSGSIFHSAARRRIRAKAARASSSCGARPAISAPDQGAKQDAGARAENISFIERSNPAMSAGVWFSRY